MRSPGETGQLADSITGSPGCWRALLWNRLQSTGFTNIDFVGTLPPQGCGVPYDGDNEGHGGILATNIANQNQLPPWLSATHPDIVLMHLGTNDVWNNLSPTTILSAFSTMLGQMRASNPAMKLIVAALGSTPPTTTVPPTTVPPTTTRPPTTPPASTPPPTGGGGCTATYAITNQWPGGFGANVTVRMGTTASTGWTVAWTFANGQTVTQIWNATDTVSGASHTARNLSYNGAVPANGTTTFGFNGSWTGTNSVPTLTCTRS